MQSLVCMCGPGQLLPPCCGEGELQNRSLICTPELHSDEQGDHRDHADQPPFTESRQTAFFFSPNASAVESAASWEVLCNTRAVYSVAWLLLLGVSVAGGAGVVVVEGRKRVVAAPESSSESNIIYMIEARLCAL